MIYVSIFSIGIFNMKTHTSRTIRILLAVCLLLNPSQHLILPGSPDDHDESSNLRLLIPSESVHNESKQINARV